VTTEAMRARATVRKNIAEKGKMIIDKSLMVEGKLQENSVREWRNIVSI
jgi:hypothetical protein